MGDIGFRPRHDEEDEEYYPNPLGGTGHVGQLTDGDDTEDDAAAWTFKHHIYISLQIGPFAIVFGRPE